MHKSLQLIEALLFVSGRPLSIAEISATLKLSEEEVIQQLKQLQSALSDQGINLVFDSDQAQLVSNPHLAEQLAPFIKHEQAQPLSTAALETLSIILYKQPVTRAEIEEIRGITSDQSINNLLQRGLISEAGARKEPGRPMQYRASTEALRILGIQDVSELPSIEETSHHAS